MMLKIVMVLLLMLMMVMVMVTVMMMMINAILKQTAVGATFLIFVIDSPVKRGIGGPSLC